MAIDSNYISVVPIQFPAQMQTVEDLQLEALEALMAQEVPSDKRQQFLDHVNQHAGAIIKFLDFLDERAETPFNIVKTARLLFGELREIGAKLAEATDSNRSQVEKELSAYEPFRTFQVSLNERSPPKKRHTPTFSELLATARNTIAEDHVQHNIALARLVGGAISAGTTLAVEGAIMGACNINPVAAMACKAIKKIEAEAGHPIQQAFAQVASLQPKNQALSLELYSQNGIPLEEGRQYGKDAFEVALASIPVPSVAKLGRGLLLQTAKPLRYVVIPREVKLSPRIVELSPQARFSKNRTAGLQSEKELIFRLNASTPRVHPPVRTSYELLLSDYVQYQFKEANLLMKVYDGKAFHIFRKKFGMKELLPQKKKLETVLEGVCQFAKERGLTKVMLAWDPAQYPFASFLQKNGIEILGMGELASVQGKMLSLTEFAVPSKPIVAKAKFKESAVAKLIKEDAGSLVLPGSKRQKVVIARNFSEVNALGIAQRVDALKKPWAHEPLLHVHPITQQLDLSFEAKGYLKRYNVEELVLKECHVKDGYVFQGSANTPLHSHFNMNFVLLKDGTIRVDFKHMDNMLSFHSSLAHGEGVVAAGEVKFINGRISWLNENSGHFQPRNRVYYMEHELKERGALFTNDYTIQTADELM